MLVPDVVCLCLQCALLFSQMPSGLVGKKLENEHLCDAVNIILSLQVKIVDLLI